MGAIVNIGSAVETGQGGAWRMRRRMGWNYAGSLLCFEGTQPFFDYPRILGHELAGDLVDLDRAPGFAPGEAVTVIPYFNCGGLYQRRKGKPNCCVTIKVCGVHIDGGMVDYLSVPSASLVLGEGLSYDQLALVEPLAIGAHAIRRAGVQAGEFVLVVGAGPIGLGVIEARGLPAGEVIAMDVNAEAALRKDRLELLHTVPAGVDAMEAILRITRGELPSVVVDATGTRRAIDEGFRYLAHGGRYVLVGLQKGRSRSVNRNFINGKER